MKLLLKDDILAMFLILSSKSLGDTYCISSYIKIYFILFLLARTKSKEFVKYLKFDYNILTFEGFV